MHAGGARTMPRPTRVALTVLRTRGYYDAVPMLRHTVRASRIAAGVVLILLGIVLALPLVPGPGVLVMFGGLTLLAAEFEWARRLRDRLRASCYRVLRRTHGR